MDSRGRIPAREIYLGLSDKNKAKVQKLFKWVADLRFIPNREKFRQLGPKAGGRGRHLWEFKEFQIRFLGDYRPGQQFVISHGVTGKKGDNLSKSDIDKAVRILDEHDARGRDVR